MNKKFVTFLINKYSKINLYMQLFLVKDLKMIPYMI